jgi:hypothetical protein
MQFEAALARAVTGDQRRPFGLGLLDAILAEHALAGSDDRLDRPASRQAAAICSRTAAMPSDRFVVSIWSTRIE